MSNRQRRFVHIQEEFYKLDGLTILSANLLALIAAFRGEGLRMSNEDLAKFFNVERCTIIRSINKLREKNYITNKGGHQYNRRLVASGVILILLDSVKMPLSGSKTIPEVVSKSHKTGSKTLPITKEREEKVSTASPLPAFEGRASAVQTKVATQAERREIFEKMPDSSPFKRAILARQAV
ncbi:MAG: helix-turn-helix domain-containing protein [Sedimentisphaerales bacterium]